MRVLLVVAALVLAGCGGEAPPPTPEPATTVTCKTAYLLSTCDQGVPSVVTLCWQAGEPPDYLYQPAHCPAH